jgi:hypothetical protein
MLRAAESAVIAATFAALLRSVFLEECSAGTQPRPTPLSVVNSRKHSGTNDLVDAPSVGARSCRSLVCT